ncbi:MAG: AAA family ATPase [Prevotella sp.]|nr:AAA family ATPase [Prevotella sp.]
MTDLTFVTSNQTKLAHARYLCRDYNVNILSYKKFYYGIGYDEPRIYDRKQLLTASFYDAAARWKRNVSGSEDRIFFIEDTSMRLDALSDEENEVPGVDVKYWMKSINFEKLDAELRKHGNNRKCSVTSHIILFLTEELKKNSGIYDDYKVFKSTVYGNVTDKEHNFDTNILYPWLDDKTFNKWFVPDGHDLPVSMLDITNADAGDFRKEAFKQMLSFLKTYGAIEDKRQIPNQLSLEFYDSFVVCGRTCSGKSTLGKHLVDDYGYYHIEASEFMTHKRLDTHGTRSKVDKHLFAANVLKTEPVFVVNRLIEYMHRNNIYDRFIITGFRTKGELLDFITRFHAERLKLVFVNTSFEERFRRWKLRQREKDNYTEERFRAIDRVQESMGIGEIANMQGIISISNDTTEVVDVYKCFEKKFLKNQKKEHVNIANEDLKYMKISLERAILITLALEFGKDQSRWYTTTEIAHLVNNYFKLISRSKNNVSRYFNQAFYVYYEVQCVNRKNRYRISPIGYSEAIKILRHINHYIGREYVVKSDTHEVINPLSIDFGN